MRAEWEVFAISIIKLFGILDNTPTFNLKIKINKRINKWLTSKLPKCKDPTSRNY